MPSLMPVWRANIDVCLTIDIGKIISYMTKYVTKSEDSMTKGTSSLIQRVMAKQLEDNQSVHAVLRKAMGKLLGERMRQRQECCQLIQSLPTVSCSHSFFNLNVSPEPIVQLLAEQSEVGEGGACKIHLCKPMLKGWLKLLGQCRKSFWMLHLRSKRCR